MKLLKLAKWKGADEMNELIKIENKRGIQTVNARDLHGFLDVQSKFADWIKNRIDKYDFIDGKDFTALSKSLENGGIKKEYHITLNMAKELSMVENNKRGRQARLYFIECEKKLISGNATKKLTTRERSKIVRNQFTDILKEHGYESARDYRDTTWHMKNKMGITVKKDYMDEIELCKITAAEMIATANIIQKEVNGYREVDPVCVDAARVVQIATHQSRQLSA
jgi:phage anti-repressor protein